MTPAVALLLLGTGLLLWPVRSGVERRLDRLRRVARVASRVVPAARPAAPGDRVRTAVLLAVACAAVVAGLSGGPPLGIATGAAGAAAAVVGLSARAARRQAGRRRDLLTALAVLRGELDAGAAFPDALAVARERAGSATAVFDLGTDLGTDHDTDRGTDRGADRNPARPDVVAHARRCLTAAAGLVAVTGAPWSAVVAGLGHDVAAHDAREREVASALAGARASTVVLGGLPVLGLGLAAALGADPVGFLLHAPTGRWVLAAGAGLDLLGVLTSTAVTARAAR